MQLFVIQRWQQASCAILFHRLVVKLNKLVVFRMRHDILAALCCIAATKSDHGGMVDFGEGPARLFGAYGVALEVETITY